MSDSFDGTAFILLQPASAAVPFTFTFARCTTATANDGSLPFNANIGSIAIKAFNEAGDDVTAAMIAGSSVADNVVSLTLNYPAAVGRYSIEFVLTLNTGAVLEFDFTRVFAEDLTA